MDLNGSVDPCALSDAKKWSELNGFNCRLRCARYGERGGRVLGSVVVGTGEDGIDVDARLDLEVFDLNAGDENVDMGDAAGEGNVDEDRLGVSVEALRACCTSIGEGMSELRYRARGAISCVDREQKCVRRAREASISKPVHISMHYARTGDKLTCALVAPHSNFQLLQKCTIFRDISPMRPCIPPWCGTSRRPQDWSFLFGGVGNSEWKG